MKNTNKKNLVDWVFITLNDDFLRVGYEMIKHSCIQAFVSKMMS